MSGSLIVLRVLCNILFGANILKESLQVLNVLLGSLMFFRSFSAFVQGF